MAAPDPFKLLRVLEDVSETHAKTLRALERTLNRLRRDPGDEALQSLALTYIKRLRVLRRRIERQLGDEGMEAEFGDVDPEVARNVATLSEYMIIVGFLYEEELLRKALILARRGARLLAEEAANIEADLDMISRLSERFQRIVDAHY